MKHPLGTVSKNILMEGLNRFHSGRTSFDANYGKSQDFLRIWYYFSYFCFGFFRNNSQNYSYSIFWHALVLFACFIRNLASFARKPASGPYTHASTCYLVVAWQMAIW